MIEKLHIIALKSIKDLTVKCSKLNLLVGTNSSGKLMFLQALMLLAQEELMVNTFRLVIFVRLEIIICQTNQLK